MSGKGKNSSPGVNGYFLEDKTPCNGTSSCDETSCAMHYAGLYTVYVTKRVQLDGQLINIASRKIVVTDRPTHHLVKIRASI